MKLHMLETTWTTIIKANEFDEILNKEKHYLFQIWTKFINIIIKKTTT
jgi:hypothetical protein